MNPLQLLLILRAHYKIALVVFILTLAAGIGVTLYMPKIYVSTASLVFDVKSPDPVAGMMFPVNAGYMATQAEIIQSDRLAQQVATTLKLDQNPTLKQQWKDEVKGKGNLQLWVGSLLQKGLSVAPSKGATIIDISYASGDPVFAATIANAYAQAYIIASIEFKVDPARQYTRWFEDQAKVMRENLEKAQAKLSEYQQQHGIVAKEDQADVEMAKLNELSAQLTAAMGRTVEVQGRARSGSDMIPEVSQASLVQSLRSDIAKQETKLRETGENLGRNHPQYQRMEAEIASLRTQLEKEKQNVASGFAASANLARNTESQLRGAIAAQKKKLLELRTGRDQLAVLQRDVDAAKTAYDSVTKRYNQTNLESQVTQTNVSVLNPAVEPLVPASPNIKKNIATTFLIALLLGGGAAFLLEMLDRRIRTVNDLEEMLQLPVLVVLERPRRSNRLLLGFTRNKPRLGFK